MYFYIDYFSPPSLFWGPVLSSRRENINWSYMESIEKVSSTLSITKVWMYSRLWNNHSTTFINFSIFSRDYYLIKGDRFIQFWNSKSILKKGGKGVKITWYLELSFKGVPRGDNDYFLLLLGKSSIWFTEKLLLKIYMYNFISL